MPMRWRLTAFAGTLLLLGSALPAAATDRPLLPSDSDAPGGRFVVTWRETAPAQVRIGGVTAVRRAVEPPSVRRHRRARERSAAVARTLRADPRVRSVVPDAVLREYAFPSDPPADMHYSGADRSRPDPRPGGLADDGR